MAQVTFKDREFSMATENDVYLLQYIDRYYTDGRIAHGRWVPKRYYSDSAKVIFDIELAHKIYTPQSVLLRNINRFHRPYAGLLYAGFSVSRFKTKTQRLMLGIEVGVSGRASGAQQVHEWYHDLVGFPSPQGWKYQIPTEFISNFKAEFNRQFMISPGSLDVVSSTALSAGTAFTHAVQRLDFRAGKLQWLRNSSFKNALIGSGSEKIPQHMYFILGFGIQYVVHNLTIDGSVWNNEAPHTMVSTPWVKHFRVGWVVNSHKATFKLTYNRLSPETSTSTKHSYIGVELLLRFSPPKQNK